MMTISDPSAFEPLEAEPASSPNLAHFDLDRLRIDPILLKTTPIIRLLFGIWVRLVLAVRALASAFKPRGLRRLSGRAGASHAGVLRETLDSNTLPPPANDGAPGGSPRRSGGGFRFSRYG